MAKFCAVNLIRYGHVIQVGSGTTFDFLVDAIFNRQTEQQTSLDLVIMTTNLRVVEKGREALMANVGVLGGTQIILTGGALHRSLHSLVGPFAADGVQSQTLIPDFVFWGAGGLRFRDKFLITYQFGDELGVQEAYATRPTSHRVLLCDHTKFRSASAWRASISPELLLAKTNQCSIITTIPDDEKEAKPIRNEIEAFKALINDMVNDEKFKNKEFALRVVDIAGEEVTDLAVSLNVERKKKGHNKAIGVSII